MEDDDRPREKRGIFDVERRSSPFRIEVGGGRKRGGGVDRAERE